jgi:hypothetical protein
MTMIPIEVSTEQLLRAVEQLPAPELDAFVAQVVALRAQRAAPHLSQQETALLLQINAGMPPSEQARFDLLVAKREAEAIADDELQELVALTDQVEQHDAQRLAALLDLAQLRHTTAPLLMDTLGIKAPSDV